jgi:hypothetical protein
VIDAFPFLAQASPALPSIIQRSFMGKLPSSGAPLHGRIGSQIVGPHFEEMCRQWARWDASAETYGGYPLRVSSGTVSDPAGQTSHQVDVAVLGQADSGLESLLAIGEVTWQETMTVRHLKRLERIRELLRQRQAVRAETTRLLCFSGTGFDRELVERSRVDPAVQLVGLRRLYEGS